MRTLRTIAWGLGLVGVVVAVAYALDDHPELRRVFRVLPGGRR